MYFFIFYNKINTLKLSANYIFLNEIIEKFVKTFYMTLFKKVFFSGLRITYFLPINKTNNKKIRVIGKYRIVAKSYRSFLKKYKFIPTVIVHVRIHQE